MHTYYSHITQFHSCNLDGIGIRLHLLPPQFDKCIVYMREVFFIEREHVCDVHIV